MNEVMDLLARHPFFSSLSRESLEQILQQMVPRTFEAKALIYSQGDSPRGFHLIVSGSVRIYRSTASGKEQNLRRLTRGQSFADVSAFDGQPAVGFAQAMEPVTLLILPGRSLHELAQRDPTVARGILEVWSHRIRELSDLAGRLSLQQVTSRVAAVLLQLADSGTESVLPKKEDLATTVGTVREVAARALKQLERKRLIRLGPRRQFRILNRGGLEHLGGWPFPVPASPPSAASNTRIEGWKHNW